MPETTELIAAAAKVRGNAYAPYSGFKVGAALRAEDGVIYVGANVENVSYPEGLCAEAAALAAMVAAGARRVVAVAIVTESVEPTPPCGGCRQKLREFGAADTPVHLASTAGAQKSLSLGELLPLAFGASHLKP